MNEEKMKDIRTYMLIILLAFIYIGISFYIAKERILDGIVEVDSNGIEIEFVKEK